MALPSVWQLRPDLKTLLPELQCNLKTKPEAHDERGSSESGYRLFVIRSRKTFTIWRPSGAQALDA
jgi:hypothetical protein